MRRSTWRYAVGAGLMLAVAALVLAVFSLLSATDKVDVYMLDTDQRQYGWRYELLIDGQVRDYEPEDLSEWGLTLPAGTQAVRISRVMTETLTSDDRLKWSSYLCGVEVALDGELLYSDFSGAEHDKNGFIVSAPEQAQSLLERRQSLRAGLEVTLELPEGQLDGELSMTTYFPPAWTEAQPVYPTIGAVDTQAVRITVSSVVPVAMMTVSAILALLLVGVYLLDISNGRADARTLLLCLYFVLLFLDQAYDSNPGYYSLLTERLDLRFLQGVHIAPLYLYLALRLDRPWKQGFCGAVVAWALYEGVRMFLNVRQGELAITGRSGLAAFVLFLAFAVFFGVRIAREKPEHRGGRLGYGLLALVTTALCILGQAHKAYEQGIRLYLRDVLGGSLLMGNFMPLVILCANISAIMAAVVLVVEFVRRTMGAQREMSALRERGRQTLESYERLLAAQDGTRALHHEMRHHMTSLAAILQSGDVERARSYVDAVAGDLDQLPVGRYSQNVLVNVIAGSYLDRAREQRIRVEHRLNVPPELNIADEDLSVFLSNMLQNALEACERIDPQQERYIRADMWLRGKFLFIRCVNSTPDVPGQRRLRPHHGYGLAAMRRIAEKYDSVLVVDHTPGEFSVMSDLCLRQR